MEVPDPYADAKALLLAETAAANGCSTVWSKTEGVSTVFGFGPELDAVDTLFTSLLVQATSALRRHGTQRDQFGVNRTKRFRRPFLMAFSVRIGQRLRETVDAQIERAQDDIGASLVPILTRRQEAARLAAEAAFPGARTRTVAISDVEGRWYAGAACADQADLSIGPSLARRST